MGYEGWTKLSIQRFSGATQMSEGRQLTRGTEEEGLAASRPGGLVRVRRYCPARRMRVPCYYTGLDMTTPHRGPAITEEEWTARLDHTRAAVQSRSATPNERYPHTMARSATAAVLVVLMTSVDTFASEQNVRTVATRLKLDAYVEVQSSDGSRTRGYVAARTDTDLQLR